MAWRRDSAQRAGKERVERCDGPASGRMASSRLMPEFVSHGLSYVCRSELRCESETDRGAAAATNVGWDRRDVRVAAMHQTRVPSRKRHDTVPRRGWRTTEHARHIQIRQRGLPESRVASVRPGSEIRLHRNRCTDRKRHPPGWQHGPGSGQILRCIQL